MKRAKLVRKYKIKKKNVYIFIVLLIIIGTILIYKNFSDKIDNKVLSMIRDKMDVINASIINRAITSDVLLNINIDDVLIVNKNKNEEIILLDFNMNNSYNILRNIISNLEDSILNVQQGNLDDLFFEDDDIISKDGFLIKFPLGMVSNYTFLNNLGPRISLKVQIGGSVVAGFETKITDYGINNSLIQVFVKCNLTEKVFFPLNVKKINFEYEFLVASKIIQGKIPTYYGGALNSKSPMLSMPIM